MGRVWPYIACDQARIFVFETCAKTTFGRFSTIWIQLKTRDGPLHRQMARSHVVIRCLEWHFWCLSSPLKGFF